MAKNTVKKPTKKAASAKRKSSTGTKKTGAGGTKKSPAKKPVSDKEKQLRQANLIANSEKKKKVKRPKKGSTAEQTSSLLDSIVEGMQEKKAHNITIINLMQIENRVCDYFVICDADSKTHVEAIADSVEEYTIKRTNEKPYHAEGFENAEWILIDYINVVVHVFLKEVRDYYNIEALWADADFQYVD